MARRLMVCSTLRVALRGSSNGQSTISHSARTLCSTTSPGDTEAYGTGNGIVRILRYPSAYTLKLPMSRQLWDRLTADASRFAAVHGSLFCDEVVNQVGQRKLMLVDAKCKPLQAELLSGKPFAVRSQVSPSKSLPQLEQMATRYLYALKEEARREKLYMEYMVRELRHWDWLNELLDARHTAYLLDFLNFNCPYVPRVSLARGLKLHMLRIPYEHLTKPLSSELKEQLLKRIDNAYSMVGHAILEMPCPPPRVMRVKVQYMEHLALKGVPSDEPSCATLQPSLRQGQAKGQLTTSGSVSKKTREKQHKQHLIH